MAQGVSYFLLQYVSLRKLKFWIWMSIQVILVLINCLLAYLCTAIDVEKVVNRTAFHVIKILLVSIPKSPRTIKSESIKT